MTAIFWGWQVLDSSEGGQFSTLFFSRPRQSHGQTVADVAFSHKIDYVTIFKEILNPEAHPNRITGSKVTAILMNGWILLIGGASSGRLCASEVTPFWHIRGLQE